MLPLSVAFVYSDCLTDDFIPKQITFIFSLKGINTKRHSLKLLHVIHGSSFSVRFGFVFYTFFRLGIEFCVNMTSNDNLHARLKSVPSLLDWVDLILKSVYRILAVLILGFYL